MTIECAARRSLGRPCDQAIVSVPTPSRLVIPGGMTQFNTLSEGEESTKKIDFPWKRPPVTVPMMVRTIWPPIVCVDELYTYVVVWPVFQRMPAVPPPIWSSVRQDRIPWVVNPAVPEVISGCELLTHGLAMLLF